MVQNKPAKRGRPRAYDPDAALARARDVFWTHGFAATSLDELSVATQMNRPSLYGAFGDKRAFYRTVLERYREQMRDKVRLALAPDGSLREALTRLFGFYLAVYFPEDGQPRGCFMISTGVPEAATDPDIRQLLAETFRGFDRMLEKRIVKAVSDGELPADTDCATLGRMVASAVGYIAIRSRLGESRDLLESFAAATVDHVCGKPAPAGA
ncbi:TetR/AcrR family transcriptional regulator [Microbaculum sp. FT89]|uniref:TetR/AcrR family transcriptional regulator n=1 Tax=Microbaculum sp. FT89 TaxID=3447298 RepID=UPI003F5330A6